MRNIITIERPTLTADERERRMEQIRQAAARLIMATSARIVGENSAG